jgi:hypothetical protein
MCYNVLQGEGTAVCDGLPYKMLTASTESIRYKYDETEGSTVVMKLR